MLSTMRRCSAARTRPRLGISLIASIVVFHSTGEVENRSLMSSPVPP